MGVEVVAASDVVAPVPVEAVTEVDKSILHEKENGKMDKELGPKEAIKFGSHEREVEKKVVGADVADANARMNANGEWAEEKVYYFYIPRMHPIDDPKYRPQLEELDRQITKQNEALSRVYDRLRAKKAARSELSEGWRQLKTQLYDLRGIMGEKRKEMQPLQQALGKLRNNNNVAGHGGICSSEEELDQRIRSMEYRIQHESIPLSEEKQILRDMKQLELTRKEVINNALMRAKLQESLGPKDAIQDQVKHMNVDYDGVKKEHDEIFNKVTGLKKQLDALDNEIDAIDKERLAVKGKKDELLDSLRKVRGQSDEVNASFYAYRAILNQAKTLAVEKDIQSIQQLANAETEKFMLQWREKAFRDDYKKRLVASGSLDRRTFTLDGRKRLADEKPIAVVTRPPPSQVEPSVNPLKKPEETKPAAKKHAQKKMEQFEEDEEEVAGLKTQEKIPPPQVDAAKLKEMKREEEIAKAKLAMERKKKLAEKAAAKAAKRAEKEAEKKLKDREKKLKKKAGGSGPTNEEEKAGEESMEGSEPEETKVAAAPVKEQVKRENPVRYRNRPRGPESLPRALLKKKKSTNYWLWAVPAALVAVLLVFLAYYYLL